MKNVKQFLVENPEIAEGIGSEIRKKLGVSKDLDELEGSGLGMFLIKSLMDEVDYKQTSKLGTELILKKNFNGSIKSQK